MKGRKRKPLKKGFCYCKVCYGNGKVKPHKVFSMWYFRGEKITNKCPKCDGKGQLDWIEKVIGVKKEDVINLNRRKYPKILASQIINVQPMTTHVWYHPQINPITTNIQYK